MRKFLVLMMLGLLAGAGMALGAEKPACDCCAKMKKDGAEADKKAPEGHASCDYCGMDRERFAYSRVLVEFDDGTVFATCSLRCAVADMAGCSKTPKAIRVGDYVNRKLIDAKTAAWVIGGTKPGVMTREAKWAFADLAAAKAFVKDNGGRLATFDEAMAAAQAELKLDEKEAQETRKKMEKE